MQQAYWNGVYCSLDQVQVSPLDRGYLFGDGVYEVILIENGKAFTAVEHVERLLRSMDAIHLRGAPDFDALMAIVGQLAAATSGRASLYMQVTRGAANTRAHAFPEGVTPNVLAFVSPLPMMQVAADVTGFAVVTQPDQRWSRCDIKSISLLGAVLHYQHAAERNVVECLLTRGDLVTECSSSNMFIVKNGAIATPIADNRILNGITRQVVLKLAADLKLALVERDITLDEAINADEVWITSTTKGVAPILKIDSHVIGDGQPGAVWRRMRAAYDAAVEQSCRA